MRFVLILMIVSSVLLGQDTLITKFGVTYLGTFIEKTDEHVMFKEQNTSNAQPIALERVARIGLFKKGSLNLEASNNDISTMAENFELATMIDHPFTAGTLSAGSLFNYSSLKNDAEDDGTTVSTIGNEFNFLSFTVTPMLSYFVIDGVSVDAIVSMTKYSMGESEDSFNIYGLAASYYTSSNIYLGAGYAKGTSGDEDDDYKSSLDFILLQGGYLHKLASNVYLNLGFNYLSGLDQTSEYDGNKNTRDNEATQLKIDVGIKAFFSLK
ncbi:MAG: hypothetical protein HQ556_12835 [Candidatus Marinimicrobia bacterium]|nr:hypothetical protein [Candidatus Neomarinimicrobiota bacterium]